MKYKALIVDDQLDNKIEMGGKLTTRRQEYQYFVTRIRDELDTTFEIALDFAENPTDFELKVRKEHYAAAIVDAVLNEHDAWREECFTITNALKYIGNEIPIAIISSHWEDSNCKSITEAWSKPNCRTFLNWRDIQGDGQFKYAAIAFMNMISDKEKIDITMNLDANDSIRILHISDIQMGGFSSTSTKQDIGACVDKILSHWNNNSPTFIALTGDVAEYGDPGQYKAAHNWISYLFEKLTKNKYKLPARNILYVPGNHDVNLRLAASARVQLNTKDNKLEMVMGDKLQQDELLQYAYMPFRNFLSDISDCPLMKQDINDQSFAWIESRFRHLGVVFYGINTAQPANAFGIPSRQVDANALVDIGDKLDAVIENCGDKPPLVIGMGHHCPVSASGDAAVENPEAFSKLFNRRVKTALFLHGHTHEEDSLYSSIPGGPRLVRNCAATFTKEAKARPEDTTRGFSLLELKREDHSVTSLHIASFGWIGSSVKRTDNGDTVYLRKNDGMFCEDHRVER